MWGVACWLGSFVIFQEIRTSIAKKPFSFVIFQGCPDPCPPPPLDPRMVLSKKKFLMQLTIGKLSGLVLYNNVSDRVIRFLNEINGQDELDTGY